MYQRNIAFRIDEAMGDTPVVLVIGPRQSGKSTLVTRIAADRGVPYRTLDDATALAAAGSDPSGYLRGLGDRAVIDEVQRVPELALAIKASVDRDRRPGRFILTGSTNVMTVPILSDSLAGRVEVIYLNPLSQGEIVGVRETFAEALFSSAFPATAHSTAMTRGDLVRRVLTGGFPEATTRRSEMRRQSWFDSYVSTVIQRDVRDISRIAELSGLPRVLLTLAQRTGSLLNASELSRTTGIAATTLSRYLDILGAIFLFHRLPAWSANVGKRLVKAPKIHLVDSGMAGALCRLDEATASEQGDRFGPLLETFVVQEIRKQQTWSRLSYREYHYRSSAGAEVDCVLEAPDGRVVGIEVKGSATVRAGDFRGLRSLRDDAGKRFIRGVILFDGRESVVFDDDLAAIPIDALWSRWGESFS